MKSEEISNLFTDIEKLKVGQVLIFDFEGSKKEKLITKIIRKTNQVWVKDTI